MVEIILKWMMEIKTIKNVILYNYIVTKLIILFQSRQTINRNMSMGK